VAGDTLELRDRKLYVNRKEQADPFVKHMSDHGPSAQYDPRCFNFGPVVVPHGRLFMMGDNRENSSDSRFWGFLPLENIKGKAMFIYFSTDLARGYPISFHLTFPYEGYFPPRIRFTRTGRIIH
jgi:signal peptidase I